MKNLLSPTKKHVVFYFQVHQPLRLKSFNFFDIGSQTPYFDDALNRNIMERVARECYLPANVLLLKLIKENPSIKVAFSISGIALDQMDEVTPEVLQSFRALAETGQVEFFAETQYHSLACLIPGMEFEAQVLEHLEKLHQHLGVRPSIFRNTELIYSDEVGRRISKLGFNGIFCDGIERILGDRSPHRLYEHPDAKELKILLRNYRLSDDIAFRFRENDVTLTSERYVNWLERIPSDENLINIAMDYETFGEHQKKSTGIFEFLKDVLSRLSEHDSLTLATPSEAIAKIKAHEALSVPVAISWADRERDLSAWLGNAMQQDAFDTLLSLERQIKTLEDPALLKCWRLLQTSDHFYYMCTKTGDDGNVHSYFSPYPSPYEAFINFMNVLADFALLIKRKAALFEKPKGKQTISLRS